MKKLILGIVVAVSTVTLSCQKNKMSSPSNEVNTSVSTSQGDENSNVLVSAKTPTIAGTNARMLFISPDLSICVCAGTNGPCLDEIIVTPHRVALINTVVTAIQTGNQVRIRDVFSTNRNELSDYMNSEFIDGVINAVLTAHSGVNAEGTIKFIILRNVNNEVVVAYPFKQ
jgi:hypothetical protein